MLLNAGACIEAGDRRLLLLLLRLSTFACCKNGAFKLRIA